MAERSRYALFQRAGGMFSTLWSVVGFLKWTERTGHIPVVNFRNVAPPNRWIGDPAREGWSDYFQPVSNVDIEKSDVSRMWTFDKRPIEFPVTDYSQNSEYRRVFHQYISLSNDADAYVRPWVQALSALPSVLGVHARGTDMRLAKSHMAPPTPHQIDRVVSMALESSDFPHILVVTEDENALRHLRRRFGSRVLSTDSLRTSGKRKLVHLDSSVLQYRYILGLNVIRDAWLLARCDGFISGHSNVSEHVQVLRGDSFALNLQIRRPRVDVFGSRPWQIRVTNALRDLTTSRFLGPDFRLVDKSAGNTVGDTGFEPVTSSV